MSSGAAVTGGAAGAVPSSGGAVPSSVSSVPSSGALPYLDLGRLLEPLRGELREAFDRVLASGWFVLGPELEAFEAEFAARCSARYCIGVGNGLEALKLTLRAWELPAGSEVLVPAHTFVATWLAVSECGLVPVGVDVLEGTGNLDPERVEAALRVGGKIRAMIPVHLAGQPAEMATLSELARQHGLRVLEDAAQAHGARWQGSPVGSLGEAAAFSFYPGKNLGALGDGGAVVTDDAALAERLRLLRNYGSQAKYLHEIAGTNSRLDELQAAFLRVRLRHLEQDNARRRALAALYLRLLAGVPGLALPEVVTGAEPSWHLFQVRHERRDALRDYLAANGVGTVLHYPVPPHRQPAFEALRQGPFPVSDRIARTTLSLPLHPGMTDLEVQRVAELCGEWCARHG